MRLHLILLCVVAHTLAAELRWLGMTDGCNAWFISGSSAAERGILLAGSSVNYQTLSTVACAQLWSEGGGSSTWTVTLNQLGHTSEAASFVVDPLSGDLFVGGSRRVTSDDPTASGFAVRLSARDGRVVWAVTAAAAIADCDLRIDVAGRAANGDVLLAEVTTCQVSGNGSFAFVWADFASGKTVERTEVFPRNPAGFLLSGDGATLYAITASTDDGKILSFDASPPGALIWESRDAGFGAMQVSTMTGAARSVGGCVVASCQDCKLGTSLLSCKDGSAIWSMPSIPALSVVEDGSVVATEGIANPDEFDYTKWRIQVSTLDATTGAAIWSVQAPENVNLGGGMVLAENGTALYTACSSLTDDQSSILLRLGSAGEVVWQETLAKTGNALGPVLVDAISDEATGPTVVGASYGGWIFSEEQ